MLLLSVFAKKFFSVKSSASISTHLHFVRLITSYYIQCLYFPYVTHSNILD